MKVVSLKVENIKRVKSVFIEPDSALTCIGGRNAQGKSTTIDAICYALGGKKLIDQKPLRDGEDKGSVVLDLGDYLITRGFTEKGTSLKVESKEDENGHRSKYSSGQTLLDSFFTDFSFDPVAFVGLAPNKQLEQVKTLVGLDFSELDNKRQSLFEERTECGKYGKQLAGELEGLRFSEDAPKEEQSSSVIFEELEKAKAVNYDNGCIRSRLHDVGCKVEQASGRVDALKKQLEQAESELESMFNEEKLVLEKTKSLVDIDVAPIEERMRNVDSVNAIVRENKKYVDISNKKDRMTEQYKELTEKIKSIDEEKATAMSKAKFPIDGLGFNESGLTFNGLPFEQSSSAEQLRVSVAMGFAANPKLKLLLIKDGSLLDDENLELVRLLAEKEDAQVIMERVGKGEECSFIIEDGELEIKGDR